MTDNQLIDALRDCENYEHCMDCPHREHCDGAYSLNHKAANLIEKLIAENESRKDQIALLKRQIKMTER